MIEQGKTLARIEEELIEQGKQLDRLIELNETSTHEIVLAVFKAQDGETPAEAAARLLSENAC